MDIVEMQRANPNWLIRRDGPCWYAIRGTVTLQAGAADSLQDKIADAERGMRPGTPYARKH